MKIPSMTIDSTETESYLCQLGARFNADKSPYNTAGHRHPYTAVYNMLFGRFRFQPCRFVEIGIAGGASILMWRHYFLNVLTRIYGFDRDLDFIEHLNLIQLPDVYANEMDVYHEESIREGLRKIGGDLDIILDDSTHGLPEQVKIIKVGLEFLKPGGMILIEDIFHRIPNEDYEKALEDIEDQCSVITFINTEHRNKYSPGWDNDKLLLVVKK
jgi:predicted O-methyltransferase YrrM